LLKRKFDIKIFFGIFIPLEEIGSVDFTDEKWGPESYRKFGIFGGKQYGFYPYDWEFIPQVTGCLMFNNELIKKYNINPTPYELQGQGSWNWDTFKELLIQCTFEDNGNKLMGMNIVFMQHYYKMALMSNGANLVKYEDGKYVFGLDDERAYEAFDYIKELAKLNPEVSFIYPVHLNPQVRKPVHEILNQAGVSSPANLYLIEPLDYLPFIYLMNRSYLVLTDSGGIQEEAPGLGKPVLVMRNNTERPEAVEAGTVILVGTDKFKIITEANRLLNDPDYYRNMSNAVNPYGDGKACMRIVEAVEKIFQSEE
jgi:hypothetical protein